MSSINNLYSNEYIRDNGDVCSGDHLNSSNERDRTGKILVNDEQVINSINLSLEKSLEDCAESTSNDSLCTLSGSSNIIKTKKWFRRRKISTSDETEVNNDEDSKTKPEESGDIALINTINECLMSMEESSTSDNSDNNRLGEPRIQQSIEGTNDDFWNIFKNGNVKITRIKKSDDDFKEGVDWASASRINDNGTKNDLKNTSENVKANFITDTTINETDGQGNEIQTVSHNDETTVTTSLEIASGALTIEADFDSASSSSFAQNAEKKNTIENETNQSDTSENVIDHNEQISNSDGNVECCSPENAIMKKLIMKTSGDDQEDLSNCSSQSSDFGINKNRSKIKIKKTSEKLLDSTAQANEDEINKNVDTSSTDATDGSFTQPTVIQGICETTLLEHDVNELDQKRNDTSESKVVTPTIQPNDQNYENRKSGSDLANYSAGLEVNATGIENELKKVDKIKSTMIHEPDMQATENQMQTVNHEGVAAVATLLEIASECDSDASTVAADFDSASCSATFGRDVKNNDTLRNQTNTTDNGDVENSLPNEIDTITTKMNATSHKIVHTSENVTDTECDSDATTVLVDFDQTHELNNEDEFNTVSCGSEFTTNLTTLADYEQLHEQSSIDVAHSDLNTSTNLEKSDSLSACKENEPHTCKINIRLMIQAAPQTNTFEENVQTLFQNLNESFQSSQCSQQFDDILVPRPIKLESDDIVGTENENLLNDQGHNNLVPIQENIALKENQEGEQLNVHNETKSNFPLVKSSNESIIDELIHEGTHGTTKSAVLEEKVQEVPLNNLIQENTSEGNISTELNISALKEHKEINKFPMAEDLSDSRKRRGKKSIRLDSHKSNEARTFREKKKSKLTGLEENISKLTLHDLFNQNVNLLASPEKQKSEVTEENANNDLLNHFIDQNNLDTERQNELTEDIAKELLNNDVTQKRTNELDDNLLDSHTKRDNKSSAEEDTFEELLKNNLDEPIEEKMEHVVEDLTNELLMDSATINLTNLLKKKPAVVEGREEKSMVEEENLIQENNLDTLENRKNMLQVVEDLNNDDVSYSHQRKKSKSPVIKDSRGRLLSLFYKSYKRRGKKFVVQKTKVAKVTTETNPVWVVEDLNNSDDSVEQGINETTIDDVEINDMSESRKRKIKITTAKENLAEVPLSDTAILDNDLHTSHVQRKNKSDFSKLIQDNKSDKRKKNKNKLVAVEDAPNEFLNDSITQTTYDTLDLHKNINDDLIVDHITNQEINDTFESRKRKKKKSTALEENINMTSSADAVRDNSLDSHKGSNNETVVVEENNCLVQEIKPDKHKKKKNKLAAAEDAPNEFLNNSITQTTYDALDLHTNINDDLIVDHITNQEINDTFESRKRKKKKSTALEESINMTSSADAVRDNSLDSHKGRKNETVVVEENNCLAQEIKPDKHKKKKNKMAAAEDAPNEFLNNSVTQTTYDPLDLHKNINDDLIVDHITNQEINDTFESHKRKKKKSTALEESINMTSSADAVRDNSLDSHKGRKNETVVAEENKCLVQEIKPDKHKKKKNKLAAAEDAPNEFLNNSVTQMTYDPLDLHKNINDDLIVDHITNQEINDTFESRKRKRKKSTALEKSINMTSSADAVRDNSLDSHNGRKNETVVLEENNCLVPEIKPNKHKKKKNKSLVIEHEPNQLLNDAVAYNTSDLNELIMKEPNDSFAEERKPDKVEKRKNKLLVVEDGNDKLLNVIKKTYDMLDSHIKGTSETNVGGLELFNDINDRIIQGTDERSHFNKRKTKKSTVEENSKVLLNETSDLVSYLLVSHKRTENKSEFAEEISNNDSLSHTSKSDKRKKRKEKLLVVEDRNSELLNVIQKTYDILDSHIKETSEANVGGVELFNDGVINERSHSDKVKIKKSTVVEENSQVLLNETSDLISYLLVSHKRTENKSEFAEEISNKDSLSHKSKSDKRKKIKKKLLEVEHVNNDAVIKNTYDVMDPNRETTNEALVDNVMNDFNDSIIQEINYMTESCNKKKKKSVVVEGNLDDVPLYDTSGHNGNLLDSNKRRTKKSPVGEESPNNDDLSHQSKSNKHKKRKKKLLVVEDINNELLNDAVTTNTCDVMDINKDTTNEALVDDVMNDFNDGTIQEINCVPESRERKKKKSAVVEENLDEVPLIDTSGHDCNLLDTYKRRTKKSSVGEENPNNDDLSRQSKSDKHKKRKNKLLVVEDINNELNDPVTKNTYDIMDTNKEIKTKKSSVEEENSNNANLSHKNKSHRHKKTKKKLLVVEDINNELLNDAVTKDTYDVMDTNKETTNEAPADDVINDFNDGIIKEINYVPESRKRKKKKPAVEENLDDDPLYDNSGHDDNLLESNKRRTKKSSVGEENPNNDDLSRQSKTNKHKKRNKKLLVVEDINNELLSDAVIRSTYNVIDANKETTNEALDDVMNDFNGSIIQEINSVPESRERKKKKSAVVEEHLADVPLNDTSGHDGNLLDSYKRRTKKSSVEEENSNNDDLSHKSKSNKHKKRKKKVLVVEDINNELINDAVIKSTYDVMDPNKETTNESLDDVMKNFNGSIIQEINYVPESRERKKKKSVIVEENLDDVPLNDTSGHDGNLSDLYKKRRKKSYVAEANPNIDDISHKSKSDKHKKRKKKLLVVEDLNNGLLNDATIKNTYEAIDANKKTINDALEFDLKNDFYEGIIQEINNVLESHDRKKKKSDEVPLNDTSGHDDKLDSNKVKKKKSPVEENPNKDDLCHKSKSDKHKKKKKKLLVEEDINNELTSNTHKKAMNEAAPDNVTNDLLSDSINQDINDVSVSLKKKKKKTTDLKRVEENLDVFPLNDTSCGSLLDSKEEKQETSEIAEENENSDSLNYKSKSHKHKKMKKNMLDVEDINNELLNENLNEATIVTNELLNGDMNQEITDVFVSREENVDEVPLNETLGHDDNLLDSCKRRRKKSYVEEENPSNDDLSLKSKSDKHKKRKKNLLVLDDINKESLNDVVNKNTYGEMDTQKDTTNEAIVDGSISQSPKRKKKKSLTIEENLDVVPLNDSSVIDDNTLDTSKGRKKKSLETPNKDSGQEKTLDKDKKNFLALEDLNNVIKHSHDVIDLRKHDENEAIVDNADCIIQQIINVPHSLKRKEKKSAVVEQNCDEEISLNDNSIIDNKLLPKKNKNKSPGLNNKFLNEKTHDVIDLHKKGTNEAIEDDISIDLIQEIIDTTVSRRRQIKKSAAITTELDEVPLNHISVLDDGSLDSQEGREKKLVVAEENLNMYSLDRGCEFDNYNNDLPVVDDPTNELLSYYNALESNKKVNDKPTVDDVTNNLLNEDIDNIDYDSIIQGTNDICDSRQQKSKVVELKIDKVPLNDDLGKGDNLSRSRANTTVIEENVNTDLLITSLVLECNDKLDKPKKRKNKFALKVTNESLNFIEEANGTTINQKSSMVADVSNKLPLDVVIRDVHASDSHKKPNKSMVLQENFNQVQESNDTHKKRKKKTSHSEDLINPVIIEEGKDVSHSTKGSQEELIANDEGLKIPLYDARIVVSNKLDSLDRKTTKSVIEENLTESLNNSTIEKKNSVLCTPKKRKTQQPKIDDLINQLSNDFTDRLHKRKNKLSSTDDPTSESLNASKIQACDSHERGKRKSATLNEKIPLNDFLIYDGDVEGDLNLVRDKRENQKNVLDGYQGGNKEYTEEDDRTNEVLNDLSDYHEEPNNKTSALDNNHDNSSMEDLLDLHEGNKTNLARVDYNHLINELSDEVRDSNKDKKSKSPTAEETLKNIEYNICDTSIQDNKVEWNTPKRTQNQLKISENSSKKLSIQDNLDPLKRSEKQSDKNCKKRKHESPVIEEHRNSELLNDDSVPDVLSSPRRWKSISRSIHKKRICRSDSSSRSETSVIKPEISSESSDSDESTAQEIRNEKYTKLNSTSQNISPSKNKTNFANDLLKLEINDTNNKTNKTGSSSPVKLSPIKIKKIKKSLETPTIKQTSKSPSTKKNDNEVTPHKFSKMNFLLDKPKLKFSRKATTSEELPENKKEFKSILKQSALEETFLANEYSLLRNLYIVINWDVPLLHRIETRISTGPSKGQWEQLQLINVKIKNGSYSREEDETIVHNFECFCKKHNLPNDPKPFLNIQIGKTNLLTPVNRVKFGQYIGRGLNERLLYRIYTRFQLIFSEQKKGRFTKEEDNIIIKYMTKKKNTDTSKFSTLSKILKRPRLAIEKRYKTIVQNKSKDFKSPIKIYTHTNVTTFLTTLKQVTKVNKLEELKGRDITPAEWKEVSEKINLPVRNLRLLWTRKLYSEAFATEPLDVNKYVWKLIDKFIESGQDDFRSLNWKEISKDFIGLTHQWLYYNFNRAIKEYCPAPIQSDLKECLTFLKTNFQNTRLCPDIPRLLIKEEEVHVI